MSNNILQEVVFIIDRSGSMAGKEDDTIGGINTMINKLKTEKGDNENILISLKFFDHDEYLKIRNESIDNCKPLVNSDLIPRGQTAIYDAMGRSIKYFMQKKDNNKDAFTECLIVTATDGLENCSTKYNTISLKKIITEAKEKYNIKCIYLAANQDAILEAGNIGIDKECAINYDESGDTIKEVYRSAAAFAKRSRSHGEATFTSIERQLSQPSNYNIPKLSRQIGIEEFDKAPSITRHATIG